MQKPIRILYLTFFFPGFQKYSAGGSERSLQKLVTHLVKMYPQDFKITIYVMQDRIKKSPYPVPESVSVIGNSGNLAFLFYFLKNYGNFDMLHCVSTKRLPNRLLTLISIIWPKPVILKINSDLIFQNHVRLPLVLRKFFLSKIRKFIALSPEIESNLKKIGIDKKRIVLIPNGIDTSIYKPKTKLEKIKIRRQLFGNKIPERRLIFIYTGRIMEDIKRINTLISKWYDSNLARNDHSLVLIGPLLEKNRENHNQIRKSLSEGNKNKIFWFDSLPEIKIIKYLQASDFFILPSVSEGMSNALLEAMSCGLIPIVRKYTSGNSLLVKNGITGFEFEGDYELAIILHRAAEENRHSLDSMSQKAQNLIKQKFELNKIVQKYYELYTTILSK